MELKFNHNWKEITIKGKDKKDIEEQLKAMGCPEAERKNLLKTVKEKK